MNKRKLYIPSLIGFFFTILISQNVSFSQSKKKQIEALNLKIDSIYQVLANERNAHKTSIGSFEIQESKSKQKVDSLTKEINSVENQINSQQNNKQIIESEISRLKKEIEKQKDSLKQLLSNEEERLQISSDDSYFIFFKDDYDFNIEEPVFNPDNGYSDQIVEKEKNRISSSKHATRKVDLKINLLNGSVAIYKSSFKDYTIPIYLKI
jgi:chromosome segregation ATPase